MGAFTMITKSSSAVVKQCNKSCLNPSPNEFNNDAGVVVEDIDFETNDISQGLDDLFNEFEKKRIAGLMKILSRTMKQVLFSCAKVLDLGSHTTMNLPIPVMNHILNQMVILAEQEPYGVKGGTLVVMFSPPSTSPTSPAPVKIGRFPFNPNMVSTFELHLTLQRNCTFKVKLANIVRKVQGKAMKLVLSDKFSLEKKKLYRSSTSVYRV